MKEKTRRKTMSKKKEKTRRKTMSKKKEKKHIVRKAVYCINCKMWFDTKKGWRALRSPFGTPMCPCCFAPLMELPYDDFIEQNKKQNKLEEVMTWEYPGGSYWMVRMFKMLLEREE